MGFGAGLFSELDSMMEHMLFCFENHIRFEIYADDANFSKAGGMGWEELFEPFCPINHDKLNISQIIARQTIRARCATTACGIKDTFCPKS